MWDRPFGCSHFEGLEKQSGPKDSWLWPLTREKCVALCHITKIRFPQMSVFKQTRKTFIH